MKFLVILSLSGLLFLHSCSNDDNPTSSIVGTWEVTSTTTDILINESSIKDFYVENFGFTEEQAQALEDAFDTGTFFSETIGSRFTFNEDGTLERVSDDLISTGTYTTDQSQLALQFGVDKEEIRYQIIMNTQDMLDLLFEQEATVDLDNNGTEEIISYALHVKMELIQSN